MEWEEWGRDVRLMEVVVVEDKEDRIRRVLFERRRTGDG